MDRSAREGCGEVHYCFLAKSGDPSSYIAGDLLEVKWEIK